ncbi:hypothetical protein [Clostridium grantii]|uniref:Uncharacterized protein n=1 Tax=Clostridium grantii DSM 8605 TaxID=1121316 RepID=A0A1M5Y880_9CLOT|nr:hypothetical protein [Clostridium grantii]SHI08285.1 hypothetical protein SAMN02745207_04277 [Clostridium grantii DSM 8605]
MLIFDKLLTGMFQKKNTGEIVFHLWGELGKSYIISRKTESTIKKISIAYYTFLFSMTLILGSIRLIYVFFLLFSIPIYVSILKYFLLNSKR